MFQDFIIENVVFTLFVGGIVVYFLRNMRPYAFMVLALAFAVEAILQASHQNFLALLWLALAVASIIRYRFEKNNEGKNDLARALGASPRSSKK
jgi:hypothetical protein